MKKVAVWALVAAALAAGATACTVEEPTEAAGNKPATETAAPKSVKEALREEQKQNPEPRETEVTAEMVVDLTFAEPGAKHEFCAAYDVLGDKLGFSTFANSYGDGPPSARAVFDEAASRC
jgi:hypothetical protein